MARGRMADEPVVAAFRGTKLALTKRDCLVAPLYAALRGIAGGTEALPERTPLASWRDSLALLCIYAKGDAFPTVCARAAGAAGDAWAAALTHMLAGSLAACVALWQAWCA